MKPLKDMSILELKGAVYDNMAQMDMCKQNIAVLQQEIAQRPPETAKAEKKGG